MGLFPSGVGGEAEDGGMGLALVGDDPVPCALFYAASAGHVALAGEDEYILLPLLFLHECVDLVKGLVTKVWILLG